MRLSMMALVLAAIGCGSAVTPTPQAPATPSSQAADQPPEPAAVPPGDVSPAPGPVRGELGGKPFVPTVTHRGPKLVFETPDRSVTLSLPSDEWVGQVAPETPAGVAVPQVEVSEQTGPAPTTALYVNGYTLNLQLAPAVEGSRTGHIELTLPDAAKSQFAGTFTATRPPREVTDRPTEADAPFIEGTITLKDGPVAVTVMAVTALEASPVFEQVTGPADVPKPGQVLAASIEANPPRTALYARTPEGGDRYEFTHMPPGRYLVAARAGANGPLAWGYFDLQPAGQVNAPLTLDRGQLGRVEVKLPTDATGEVRLYPADPQAGARAIPDVVLAAVVKYETIVKDGRATFAAIAPGRYRVVAAGRVGAVTVEAGKRAEVALDK